MACTIINRVDDQRIRFTSRDAAERYAEIMGGGVHNWVFTTEPNTPNGVNGANGANTVPNTAPNVAANTEPPDSNPPRTKILIHPEDSPRKPRMIPLHR